jgi:hypothetical protein
MNDFTFQQDNNNNNSNSNNSNNCDKEKILYFPIAICLWSNLPNTDSFKQILQEAYKIITFSKCINNVSDESFDNYKYCQLLNYFVFLSSILKPANYTKMILNFSKNIIFNSLIYYFRLFNS